MAGHSHQCLRRTRCLPRVPPRKSLQNQQRGEAVARPQPGSHPTLPPAMGPRRPALRPPLLLLLLLLFLDTSVWARESEGGGLAASQGGDQSPGLWLPTIRYTREWKLVSG